MMGRLNHNQGQLFYSFHVDEVVPDDHLVREIAAVRHSLPPGGRGCIHDPAKPPRAALPILRTDRYAART
jgi:hypothetical protein